MKNLCAYETPLSRIENLSFAVEAGKITCVKGQWETGLSLLEDVVSGMKTFSKGEIFFAGKWYKEKDKFDTRLLRQKGTSIIPSDKINRGAPKSLKVEELFLVAKQNQGKNLFQGKDLISQAKVDAKLSNKVSSLSGGMLQRLILRRELSLGSDFYIFSNPTSGLDFAGIRDLISTLKNLTEKGKGILVLSVDDTEIEKICDFCIALDWKTDLEKNRK
ncbi:MAG: ATP-binding cassette domain-containing protein [Treponema sp.]|nr:ATP-binding cassette domain-containing protein [Treponema sp.]